MSERKELIKYIKIDEYSFNEVSLNNLKRGNMNNAFILCPNSFLNFPSINLTKLVNKQYSEYEIKLINQKPIKFNLLYDEIISLKNNKINFYIVNDLFLLKLGIKREYLTQLNLIYYEDYNKKYLYFINESKLLMLESNFINISNYNQPINNNIFPEDEEENNDNNLDNIYSICRNIKNFNKSINSLKDQLLDLSNINNIEKYLTSNSLIYLPIYIIKNDAYQYCLKSFNYEFLSEIEESDYNIMKEDIIQNLILPDKSNINYNIEVLPQNQFVDNIQYSFVNEEFCQKLKLPIDKYKPFKGLLFLNQNKLFIYFKYPQILLKINNYNNKDNSFNIIKFELNNDLNREEFNKNNEKLIKELEEEKNKNKTLINTINLLSEGLNNAKTIITKLSNKIELLENLLSQDKNKNIELNELIQFKKELNDLKQNFNNLNLNNDSLRNIAPDEKIIAIHFTSFDQKFHFPVPCKNNDIFVRVEEKLYNEFPDYKNYHNIYFIGNGLIIKRFKTLDENKIKNGDTITLHFFDTEERN